MTGTEPHLPTPGAPASAPKRPPGLRAGVILTLGLLPLTVMVSRHMGLYEALGQPTAPLLMVALVTLVWVGVVGGARLPHPVATLTLTGLAAGVYITLVEASVLLSQREESAFLLIGFGFVAAIQTAWGFVAGLMAAGVQRLRGPR